MTTLHVVRAGLHTTVQDAGRSGYQHLGVPVGGALDLVSFRRANRLVGNASDEAALEVTLVGGELKADGDVHVAVTGAEFDLAIDGRAVAMARPHLLPHGVSLTFGTRRAGARAYVAVRGGLEAPRVLGSRSAWPLLPRRGALRDGDRLAVASRAVGPLGAAMAVPLPARETLRLMPARDAAASPQALQALFASVYTVAASASRMAYPLEGASVMLPAADRASSGTVGGAVQILPSGQPVLLLAERQTTGGYPIVGVVATADLAAAAQLAPGDRVRFVGCTRAEALQALMQQERGDA